MHSQTRRLFFCHLQKTGGTSLIRRLQRHFPEDRVYPNRGDGNIAVCVISVPHLLTRWKERAHEIELVTGHFPLCTQELLGGGFTTFTILREPVERTLSYLRHYRRLTPDAHDKSLEEIYERKLNFHGLIHNHMVKMLSLTTEEMTAGAMTRAVFSRDRLERAKEQLAAMDAVGIHARFEEFCTELHDRFGLELGSPVYTNRSEPVVTPKAFRDRIAADNALDIELYQYATELVAARR